MIHLNLTLFKKCPKLGVEKTFTIKMLSNTTDACGIATLSPRQSQSCRFDEHLDRNSFLSYPQPPRSLCRYITGYSKLLDDVKHSKKQIMYLPSVPGVRGIKRIFPRRNCCSNSQYCDQPRTEQSGPAGVLCSLTTCLLEESSNTPGFWYLFLKSTGDIFKKCHGKKVDCYG